MRVALVIGLAAYEAPAAGGLGSLYYPHLHASRMRKQLLQQAGFDAILHCDFFGESESTRQGMYLAIQEFRSKLQALPRGDNVETVAFFYFSGHGGYNGKHHYLLPNDSRKDIDVDVQGIDFEDQILHHMAKHARLSIAVLDCCRTGKLHHEGPLSVTAAPPQCLVCHACPPFARASDNGIYTNALLQHIFKSDVEFIRLLWKAHDQLAAAGVQGPQLGPHSSFSHDFTLVTQVGWRFVQQQDFSTDFDIEWQAVHSRDGIANVRQLAMAAERHGMTALAFDTQGHIKHTAHPVEVPEKQWRPEPTGVFVRDRRVPPGWLYFPEMDSPGDDLPNMEGTVFQMASEAANWGAVAFNTNGWAKYQLKPFSAWRQDEHLHSLNGLNGIFVRVRFLKEAEDCIIPDRDLKRAVKQHRVAKHLMRLCGLQ